MQKGSTVEAGIHDDVISEAFAEVRDRASEHPPAGILFIVSGPVRLQIKRQIQTGADDAEQAERMQVVAHASVGIRSGVAQIAAGMLAAAGPGTVNRQPNEPGLVKCLVVLRLARELNQGLARRLRIEPLGEVRQAVVTELGGQSGRTSCRGVGQRLGGMEAVFPQDARQQQRPE